MEPPNYTTIQPYHLGRSWWLRRKTSLWCLFLEIPGRRLQYKREITAHRVIIDSTIRVANPIRLKDFHWVLLFVWIYYIPNSSPTIITVIIGLYLLLSYTLSIMTVLLQTLHGEEQSLQTPVMPHGGIGSKSGWCLTVAGAVLFLIFFNASSRSWQSC